MDFVKMHGLGNDFVVVDEPFVPDADLVRRMCDRHFGIGADGLLTVGIDGDVVTMGYWNADGGPAEMCGNGLRCVARRAADRGLVTGDAFVVRTPVGERRVRLLDHGVVRAEIGAVHVEGAVDIGGRVYRTASVGNPHAVAFVDDPDEVDVSAIGPTVEAHDAFPEGTNVEFVRVDGPGRIRMRVWERGVGETLACGSGMVVAAALAREGSGVDTVVVTVGGGTARVHFEEGVAWLEGPAVSVFEGVWPSTG